MKAPVATFTVERALGAVVTTRSVSVVAVDVGRGQACHVTGVSSSVVSAPFTATGASLTAVTVIDTVATFESSAPSFALNVKLSGPL